MVIGIAISLACILLIIPMYRKAYWKWATLVFVMLSLLFFFYEPSKTDDLYRYYNVLEAVRSESMEASGLLETYKMENPLFIPYLYVISLLKNNSFLPVITGIICFLLFLWLIKRTFSDEYGEHWQIVICLWLYLFLTRLMDVTGIRNILSSAVISVALYLDLVENDKKSIFLYVIGALIHSMGLVYIVLRLILLIYNNVNRIIVPMLLVSASAILTYLSKYIVKILSSSLIGSSAYERLLLYMNNQSNMTINTKYRLLYSVIYIFVLIICYIYSSGFDECEHLRKLSDYTILLVFFTFSFFGQRELFNRERLLIVPLGIVFVGELLKYISGECAFTIIDIRPEEGILNRYIISAFFVYGFLVFSIVYFFLVVSNDYTYFNSGFVFGR